MLLSRFQADASVVEAGIDEAGRGAFAGPVFAAAVIFPAHYSNPVLNDSKKLTATEREVLALEIKQHALAYAIKQSSVAIIDKHNILQATYLAMHQAIKNLSTTPDLLLIDGNRFKPYNNIQHVTIIKGDGLYQSIAAAGILAKTARDAYMRNLSKKFSLYNWETNKGYGTEQHRAAINEYGLSPHHRKSFKLIKHEQPLLF